MKKLIKFIENSICVMHFSNTFTQTVYFNPKIILSTSLKLLCTVLIIIVMLISRAEPKF